MQIKLKKTIKTLIFPPTAIVIILIPTSALFLIYALINEPTNSLAAILSYVAAFYTLTVSALKIPNVVKLYKRNRLVTTLKENTELKISISLYSSLIFNTAYAVLQLGLGIYHLSSWYFAAAAYYLSLALMRFFIVKNRGENELKAYRICGIIFLVMNFALSVMIFLMIFGDKTFRHHEITTIAMATYTFTALVTAIINVIKYKKYNRPAYSAAKAISLATACVSMLTLEATMLTVFDSGKTDPFTRRLLLALSGGAVSLFIIATAVCMIIKSGGKNERNL